VSRPPRAHPSGAPTATTETRASTTAAPGSTADSTATVQALSGPQLIQQRCTGCHGLDVVLAKKRTTAEWSAIVDQMIGYGAQLSPSERSLVMRFLPREPAAGSAAPPPERDGRTD
jgi:cytochrome c5